MFSLAIKKLKHLYRDEVRKEIDKFPSVSKEIFTLEEFSHLPGPVRRYFNHCGWIGKEKPIRAEILWGEVKLRVSAEKEFMKIRCRQFNSVPEPVRIVHMRTWFNKFIPFEARDKFQDGKGSMLIRLGRFITLSDAKGAEMDASALVTVLAEALFLPSYALQDYIRWTAIDEHSAKAAITYGGTEVSGIFYFNDEDEFVRFNTTDRYFTADGKNPVNIPWSVFVLDYTEVNGLLIPSEISVVWHMEKGEYEYFNGTITGIRFNMK